LKALDGSVTGTIILIKEVNAAVEKIWRRRESCAVVRRGLARGITALKAGEVEDALVAPDQPEMVPVFSHEMKIAPPKSDS